MLKECYIKQCQFKVAIRSNYNFQNAEILKMLFNITAALTRPVCPIVGGASSIPENGPGSGRIVYSNLRCTGNEVSLSQCSSTGGSSCMHSEDVTALCHASSGQYRPKIN